MLGSSEFTDKKRKQYYWYNTQGLQINLSHLKVQTSILSGAKIAKNLM
jgi:hypothetical protein